MKSVKDVERLIAILIERQEKRPKSEDDIYAPENECAMIDALAWVRDDGSHADLFDDFLIEIGFETEDET